MPKSEIDLQGVDTYEQQQAQQRAWNGVIAAAREFANVANDLAASDAPLDLQMEARLIERTLKEFMNKLTGYLDA